MDTEALKGDHVKKTEATAGICFEELYKYRFQDNDRFVEGWRKVKDVIAKEKLYESLIKAQVYFYSREVGQVDLDGYRNWLKENEKEIQGFDALISTDLVVTHDINIKEEGEKQVTNKNEKSMNHVSDTKSVENKSNTTESLTQEETVGRHPANFIELIEMIQSGMKLPDTENLNIEPLNEDPTPCDIQRPQKPWEVS